MTYGDAAGIWIQPSADILLENNVIYDNAFGIFTMAKNGELTEACERIVARNNKVYGNGVVNNYYDHNFYIQSTSPIIEGNYIGQTRSGSEGSSYKSRSSGEIFRFNIVVASARAIDLVHAEDQANGIAIGANYGIDQVYGNLIINDCGLGNCASNPIHYGGDNLGEQEPGSSLFTPTSTYRNHLYFFNNTVIQKVTLSQSYRTHMFDLSLVGTTVEAFNNIFYTQGDSNFSWVENAGKLNLRGNNLVFGTVNDADDQATSGHYSIQKLGNLINSQPIFVNASSGDFSLASGSAGRDQATTTPSGITLPFAVSFPLSFQPAINANGIQSRTQNGSAMDLGAFEK